MNTAHKAFRPVIARTMLAAAGLAAALLPGQAAHAASTVSGSLDYSIAVTDASGQPISIPTGYVTQTMADVADGGVVSQLSDVEYGAPSTLSNALPNASAAASAAAGHLSTQAAVSELDASAHPFSHVHVCGTGCSTDGGSDSGFLIAPQTGVTIIATLAASIEGFGSDDYFETRTNSYFTVTNASGRIVVFDKQFNYGFNTSDGEFSTTFSEYFFNSGNRPLYGLLDVDVYTGAELLPAVPEPATATMTLIGLLGVGEIGRRRSMKRRARGSR